MPAHDEITRLLQDVEAGHDGAMDELMSTVYAQLEGMARAHLRHKLGAKTGAITLEPAALVNESFLRLIRQRKSFDNRGQFFGIATRVMLRVLIDYRRERNAEKRGGPNTRIGLALDDPLVSPAGVEPGAAVIEAEDLAEALEQMEALDARKADVLKMRVVWGMSIEEIGLALDVSTSTVDRDWRFARAWLCDRAGAGP